MTKNYLGRKAGRGKAGIRIAGVLASSVVLAGALAGCGGGGTTSSSTTGGGGGSVVTVNGKSIDRNALYSHLEANYGESALRQLIDFSLITQKLEAEGLSISDAEVNAAIEARKASAPEIEQIVKDGGVRLTALQRQTRYQLALDKLLTKDVKVTDDQLKKWFATRAKYYDQPAKAKIGILLSSTKPRADALSAQLKSKSKTFQELVNAQKAANDPAARASVAESPEFITVNVLPPLLKNTVNNLQTGQNSNVITLSEGGQTAYAILRVAQKQPAVKADFTRLKPQIEMDYKLEQVARKLNGENPNNPSFDVTLERVSSAVAAQNGGRQPAFREVLTFITQTAANTLTNGLRTAAKVETTDPNYTKVAESYKTVPGLNVSPAGDTATGNTANGAPAGNAAK